MTKKLLIILFLIFSLSIPVLADQSANLNKIEDSVLGVDYPNDKVEQRVDRLEKVVYGKQKTGTIDKRIEKLAKDTSSDVIGQEIAPSRDTFKNEDDDIVKSDGTENYPIINEIEQKLFNQSTPERSLKERLSKIENKMFNQTYTSENYYDRMDRIKSKYYSDNPQMAQNNQNPDYSSNDSDNDSMAYNNNSEDYSSNSSDTTDKFRSYYSSPQMNDYTMNPNAQPYTNINPQDEYELGVLEQRILNNTYPNQTINERLSRLETKLFDTDFFYDDEKIRMDRIASAAQAKKSTKRYDNNKFYSKLNTALQIGTMVLMVLAFIF